MCVFIINIYVNCYCLLLTIGFTRKKFMSWYGMMVQHMLPYHIETGKVDDQYFEEQWLETKRAWKITDNHVKDFMRKKAVKLGTNFRSRLATKYVYKGLNACHKYTFLDPDKWEAFVLERTSAKAKDWSSKEMASKSTSATRMASSVGSPSCAGASLQIRADDTAMTPYNLSQAEVVDQYLELQTPDVMTQPEEVQGSLMNMAVSTELDAWFEVIG
ncbi:hypothetical protein Hanom_Chr13g01200521 [Helianthus anomalus]